MIATRRGLAIASVLALVLLVLVIVDVTRERAPASRTIVGAPAAPITRLAWARAGEPELVIERSGETWRWVRPVAGVPADPAAIDAVLAILRGGTWQRRAASSHAGRVRVALTATAGTRSWKVGIAAPLAGSGQTWLVVGADALLVDDWIARALAPAPLALRETRPLRQISAAETIVIELPGRSLRLAGTPRRIVRPVEVLVQPVLVAELEAAVAALAIRAVPSSPATSIAGTISTSPPVVTVELATDNHCGVDERQIGGTDGPGCVAATQWAAIDAALAKLAAPPAQLADQRLVPIDPVTITLADGVVLDLQKRPRVGDRDADSTRVAELLAILQTPAGEPSARDPSAKVTGTITIADRAGTKIELALLANRTVARAGEPVAFDAGTVWTVLTRPSRELADPTLWTEDDTTIRTITVGATTYTRGAVVGEWTATPARAVDAERVSTFARALAQLRGSPGPRATMRHTISFEVVPPGGTPTRRTLQLGARTPAGCPAIVDGEALVLDAAVCDAAARL